jgi:RimJ/RimL family protein N-acetyltransferase
MFVISLGDDSAELRPLEPWRAEEFLANLNRGREFIGQHIGLPDAVTDLASSRAFLRTYAEKAAADAGRIYGIWTTGTLVGGVLFRTMDIENGVAEAGCWLEPSAAGQGLVTRAARVIIDWAIEERGIHRVEWYVSAANEPSIAVARRLGMTKDGVLRESYLHRGKRQDVEVWSVLAPEWRSGRQLGTAAMRRRQRGHHGVEPAGSRPSSSPVAGNHRTF